MVKKLRDILGLLALASVAFSCANIVAPSGGPADKKSPSLIKSEPANYSTNFNTTSFRLYFDEFVQVKEESKNMLISPPMNEPPSIRVKGRSIIVTINDTLIKNTSYTIGFGNAIQDITEGNPLRSFQYVFSTGERLDSSSLQGKVIDAYTLKPVKDASVMLYTEVHDSLPYKYKPRYMCRSGEDGSFRFFFIRQLPYQLAVITDLNGSLLYEQESEALGFADSLVIPSESVRFLKDTSGADSLASMGVLKNLEIKIFRQEDSIQKIYRPTFPKQGLIIVAFRYPVRKANLYPLGKAGNVDWAKLEWNKTRDTVNCWLNPQNINDSLTLVAEVDDKLKDTLKINFVRAVKAGKMKKEIPGESKLNYTVSGIPFLDLDRNIQMSFGYPIATYDASAIQILEEKQPTPLSLVFVDSIRRILEFRHAWKENTHYEIFIPPQAFEDGFGHKNDTVLLKFQTRSLKDYGNLKLKCRLTQAGQYILQLLNEKETVVREKIISSSADLSFDYLMPSKYRLRVIYDKNTNGKWDTGQYLKKIQPEGILYFEKIQEVRGNWELEEEWAIP